MYESKLEIYKTEKKWSHLGWTYYKGIVRRKNIPPVSGIWKRSPAGLYNHTINRIEWDRESRPRKRVYMRRYNRTQGEQPEEYMDWEPPRGSKRRVSNSSEDSLTKRVKFN